MIRPIVFLHIPKTAGQTIHNELSRIIGSKKVSPVRLHSQVGKGCSQMPPGYGLYSGHIDWTEITNLENPFVFSVLRNPQERIASFYFYLLNEARKLEEIDLLKPDNKGKKRILENSASSYFFGGSESWQAFIRDHYDNAYCSYFASRKMRGWQTIRHLTKSEKIAQALENLAHVTSLYTTRNLARLESDITAITGQTPNITRTYLNVGDRPRHEPRWPRLLKLLDSDKDVARLTAFTTDDLLFMQEMDMQF